MDLTVVNVAGARPNFVKIAPLHRAMVASGRIRPVFVHTGQHYDEAMSQVFLDEFGLPEPDVQLGAGSGSHAGQTARIMLGIEEVLTDVAPDVVVVVGDVNSTIAAALVAAKLGVPVAHVEAGLRSFDRTMPEEINRVLTDAISDLLFAPSADGVEHLRREGIPDDRIHLVGNVMIDTLDALSSRIQGSSVLDRLGLEAGSYVVSTLHRPSNVDDRASLEASIGVLRRVSASAPVLLVAHPRTRSRIAEHGLSGELGDVRMIDPLGYVDFLRLLADARCALTDSGGIQEETTVLGVPCVTMRTTTERPITVSEGTNHLAGTDPDAVVSAVEGALDAPRTSHRPPLWDGATAPRIVDVLLSTLGVADQASPSKHAF